MVILGGRKLMNSRDNQLKERESCNNNFSIVIERESELGYNVGKIVRVTKL